MNVYLVFFIYGDGDGYASYYLLKVCENVAVAKEYIGEDFSKRSRFDIRIPAHSSMSAENNYTYIGNRKDKELNQLVPYNHAGGYLIEETKVYRILPKGNSSEKYI